MSNNEYKNKVMRAFLLRQRMSECARVHASVLFLYVRVRERLRACVCGLVMID